jgi:hypothetical protein
VVGGAVINTVPSSFVSERTEADHTADHICQYFNKLLKFWLFDNLKLPTKTRPNSAGVDTLWIAPEDKIAPIPIGTIRIKCIVCTGNTQSNLTAFFERTADFTFVTA